MVRSLFFQILFAVSLQGQPLLYYDIQQISMKEGLPEDEIQDIAQDQWGYLWMGSVSGVIRYNGRSFKLYPFHANDSSGPAGRIINYVLTTPEGNVWAFGNNHNSCLDRTSNLFFHRLSNVNSHIRPFTPSPLPEAGSFIHKSSGIWEVWDPQKAVNVPLQIEDAEHEITLDHFQSIAWVGSNDYLLATSRGVFKGVRTKFNCWKVRRMKFNFGGDPKQLDVPYIAVSQKGYVWMATQKGLFYLKSALDSIWQPYHQIPLLEYSPDKWLDIHFLSLDADNRLWISTLSEIWVIDATDPDHYQQLEIPMKSHMDFTSICHDETHRIHWLGTDWGGIIKVTEKTISVEQLATYHPEVPNQSLSDPMVYRSLYDSKGNWWFATFNGLDLKAKGKSEILHFHRKDEDPASLSNNSLCVVYEDQKHQIWIGTRFNGLCRLIDSQKGKFKRYLHEPSRIHSFGNNAYIRSIVEDANGQLWASHTGGISKYEAKEDNFRTVALPEVTPGAICPDASRYLWVAGTSRYLYKIDINSLSIAAVYSDSLFMQSDIYSMFYDQKRNCLWLGTTDKGIVQFDRQSGRFIRAVGRKEGLCGDVIAAIAADREGRLWVSTESGISCFDPDRNTFTNFGLKDGLPFDVFISSSVFTTSDGSLVFGGNQGVIKFDPMLLKKNATSYRYPLILSSLQVMGLDAKTEKPFGDLKAYQTRTDLNNIEFEFNLFDYGLETPIHYLYQLAGLDQGWKDGGDRGYAGYANLPAGHYIFKVKAINSDGREVGLMKEIRIEVVPYFYETLWFRIGVGVMLLLCSIGLSIFLVRRSLKKDLWLNKEKALKNQANQHFIFNTLNIANADILRGDMVSANRNLVRFARLMRFYYEELQESWVSLQAELKFIELYLQLSNLRYSDRWKFEIQLSPDLQNDPIWVPPLFIQPFIENAVKYAFPEVNPGGFIKVVFEKKEGYLLCTVEDNGVGFKNHEETHPERFSGIKLIQERMKIFNALHQCKGSISLLNKKNTPGAGTGVLVHILLPYK